MSSLQTQTASQSQSPPTSNAGPSTSPTQAQTTTTQTTTTTTTSTTETTTTPLTTSDVINTNTSPSTSPTITTTPTTTTQTSSKMTTLTSSIPTTIVSTNQAGSTIYVTTTVPTTIPTLTSTSNTSNTTSHTAAIVGGTVGGVAGLAVLALFFFCIRRRVRKDEFDGNFDPDRVGVAGGGGTLPRVDLADEVTPFPAPYSDQAPDDSTTQTQMMRQRVYGEPGYGYAPVGSSIGSGGPGSSEMYYAPGMGSTSHESGVGVMAPMTQGYGRAGYPTSVPVNMYGTGTGPADWHAPAPMVSPPPSTVATTSTAASRRAAKEREATARQVQGGPPESVGGDDVVVHQDAGRAPSDENVPPREIPPTYDSIRRD